MTQAGRLVKLNIMRPIELQTILDQCDLTQKALAEILKVDPHTPMRWLSGDAPIPTGTALLLRLIEGRHVSLTLVSDLRALYEG